MERSQERQLSVALLILMLAAATARVLLYGDMRLSVGNGETPGYVRSSRAPLFSWAAFAGERLHTTNLIFKLANDPVACPLTAISSPAEGNEVEPTLQPCFDRIVLLQSLLSILGWCLLAWTTSRWLRDPISKAGMTTLILLFGFTPQIAEWDPILSPESLTTSLFVILFAGLEELALQVVVRKRSLSSPAILALSAGTALVFALWLLIRDVNLCVVLTTILLVVPLVIVARHRQRWALMGVVALAVGLFFLGYLSARDSRRATRYPLVHAFDAYVLPYPSRVAFFQRLGMPGPDSPAYLPWLDKNATSTYAAFLISHPGFVVTSFWDHESYFSGEFVQQYFRGKGIPSRNALLVVGEVVHPETHAVYLLDLILLGGLVVATIRTSDRALYSLTWLMAWLGLGWTVTLMASFLGDAEAFRRHLYWSVETARLQMWLLVFIFFDLTILGERSRGQTAQARRMG